MRAAGSQRPEVGLSGRQIGHGRQIKCTPVVGIVTATVGVCRISVGEPGVVPSELFVSVTCAHEQRRTALSAHAKLDSIVTTIRLLNSWTFGAERRCYQGIYWRSPYWNDDITMQHIREAAPGVADVESQTVGNRHILDRVIKPLAGVSSFENQRGPDGPLSSNSELVALDGLHIRLNSRIARIGFSGAKILILYKARVNTWRRTGRRTTRTGRQCRRDTEDVHRVQCVVAPVPVIAAER